MTQPFPMLAAPADIPKLRYPLLGFPKIDGIRAVCHQQQALSRKLIALPNRYVQGFFSHDHFQGLDGELVVGRPNDPLCIKHTTSGVMSRGGEPDFTYYVFDKWDSASGYAERSEEAAKIVRKIGSKALVHLPSVLLNNEQELLKFEAEQLELGYEGIILRDPNGPYKHGRSTMREGGLLKLKRFDDSEAQVIAVVEEQFNGNEAQKDNLGRTKRSSAKAGKSGKGRAGTLIARDIHHGWDVDIGSGLDDADKAEWWAWWQDPARSPRLVKYKYFAVGMQERPRHPVYIAWRHPSDV